MERADTKGTEMETPEAMKIAQEEVIFIDSEKERKRLKKEMDVELRRKKQENLLKQERDQHLNRLPVTKQHAILVICRSIIQWRARNILREKCIDAFEKLFDENYCVYFYRNRFTVRIFHW